MKKLLFIVIVSFTSGFVSNECSTNCYERLKTFKDEVRKQQKECFKRLEEAKEFIYEPRNCRGGKPNINGNTNHSVQLDTTTKKEQF